MTEGPRKTDTDTGDGSYAATARQNAMRARRVNGLIYVRQGDVLRYLRDLASDWEADSHSEVTLAAAGCVRRIADEIAKVKA